MTRVLIIDNHDSFFNNIIGLLRDELGVNVLVMKNDEVDFSVIDNYDKIILSPGPGNPQEAGDMFKVIEKTYKTHSLLGVCLGHQAIVEFFGGTLKQMDNPKHGHRSTLNVLDNNDLLFRDIGHEPVIGRYHSLVADSVGDELIISSVDEDNNVMSVYHPDYKTYGVQFHPESIISNCGKDILNNWLKL